MKNSILATKSGYALLALFILCHFLVSAQGTVSGTVTDAEAAEGLPGVNVVIKGTNVGTVTDIEGNYALTVPLNGDILVFSSVGFVTQEVGINGRSTVDLVMSPDVQSLSEIVIVGYGTVRKSDLTGSVASVSGETVKEFPVASIDQGIQARAPGVQVTQASAAPGGGVSVRIRGANSINSGSEPLYVVDGFPIYPNNAAYGAGGDRRPTNALATINPNDIESIEILKDASATSIYGSRGSNGVVLITTKRGQSGQTSIQYDGSYSIQEAAKTIEVLNPQEYAEYQNLRALSRGIDAPYPNPASLGGGVNWQDEILRAGAINNHQLTFSGGNDKTRYAFSGGLYKDKGIVVNSNFKRYSLRANIDSKALNDKLTISTSTSFNRTSTQALPTDRGGPGGLIISAIGQSPIGPVYNDDGSYHLELYDGRFLMNPLGEALETVDADRANRLLSNSYLEYQLLDGLKLKSSLGFDIYNANRRTYYSLDTRAGLQNNVQLTEATRYLTNILNENILSYNKEFNENHRLDALVGYTYQKEINRYASTTNQDYAVDDAEANQLQGGLDPQIPYSERDTWELVSFISRVNYSLFNRYLLTATLRRDGSSRFGANNKWANFPSVALGWRIIEEAFMQNTSLFSDLKLRASYGITGNSEIPLYRSLSGFNIVNYSFNGVLVAGLGENRVENPDLKWESTRQFNLGLDASFLAGRLNLTTDFFLTNTQDLLLDVALPTSSGFNTALLNSGSLQNRGFELGIDAIPVDNGTFSWNINGNISFLRNEITSLGESAPFYSTSTSGHQGVRGSWVEEGLPIGAWKGLNAIGLWQSEDEIENGASFPFDKPGYVRYEDVNGDGEINSDDEVIVGDPNPDFIWGLTQNFRFKNFDLSIFFRGSQGNDVRNLQAAEHADGVGNYNQFAVAYRDAWTPSNPDASRPVVDATREFANFFRNSDFFVEDGSFIRLQNVALGYTLPEISFINSARIYVSAQNLFNITEYTGYDPEVNNQGQNNLNRGDDYDAYPRARVYTMGVNLTF